VTPAPDPLARRTLGASAVAVTQLGYGAAPVGGFRGPVDEPAACTALARLLDAGVGYVDVAPFYGYGRAELLVGQVLRARPRASFVVSTKVGRVLLPLRPGEDPGALKDGGLPGFKPVFDYSYDGTLRALEQSQCRLGLARIDIALIHDVDAATHGSQDAADRAFDQAMSGAYRALDELRRAGVIGAIGTGLNDPVMSERFVEAGAFDCILLGGKYTVLEQPALQSLLPTCVRRGVSVILGMPLNTGLLAFESGGPVTYDAKTAPPALVARAHRLAAICREYGVSLLAAALQFPFSHPAVVSVIPGAASADQMLSNLDAMRAPIPPALWQRLRAEGLLDPAAPLPRAAA
jgi:D-threo-aldose 1-dehydrogenase